MKHIEVIIKTTYDCNLRCKYCYNSETHYSKEILPRERFEKLLNLLKDSYQSISIVWHGGDPLMCGHEYFEDVMEIEKRISNTASVRFRNSIQTNGTLIDKKWVDIFKKYDIKVGVSFDGINNDLYRQGTEKTLGAMELMKKKGLNFGCMAVVANDDYDLIENYKFFRQKGISVDFSYMFSEGEAKSLDKLSPEKFTKQAIELFDYWLYDREGVGIRLFSTYISMALGSGFRICSNCSCHGKYLSIAPNGDLSNCGRPIIGQYVFGNIDTVSSIEEVYNSPKFIELLSGSIQRRRKCKESCEYFELCGGDCTDQALIGGDITSPDKSSCYSFCKIYSHIKEKIDEIIENGAQLDMLNPTVKSTIIKCFNVSEQVEPIVEKYV